MSVGPEVSAQEWLAAVRLVAQFEDAVDRRDAYAFRAFFTNDGQMTGEVVASHDQLGDVATGQDDGGPPLMHFTANHTVERGLQGGLRVNYLLVVLALNVPAPTLLRTYRITDHMQFTPDGWRIQRHHVSGADITGSTQER